MMTRWPRSGIRDSHGRRCVYMCGVAWENMRRESMASTDHLRRGPISTAPAGREPTIEENWRWSQNGPVNEPLAGNETQSVMARGCLGGCALSNVGFKAIIRTTADSERQMRKKHHELGLVETAITMDVDMGGIGNERYACRDPEAGPSHKGYCYTQRTWTKAGSKD